MRAERGGSRPGSFASGRWGTGKVSSYPNRDNVAMLALTAQALGGGSCASCERYSAQLLFRGMKEKQIKVGCLFAAIGGFCRAFKQEGAEVLWANEKDKFARETF